MVHISDFVGLCLKQAGDRYRFGAEASPNDPNPDAFDCSELVEWASDRLGVPMVDGAANQWQHCKNKGTTITFAKGAATQGALLFRVGVTPVNHVAVSLGNGSTIEARSTKFGVGEFGVKYRQWTGAALVPGFTYTGPPPPPPNGPKPPFPGRYLMYPPIMKGNDVKTAQTRLVKLGFLPGVASIDSQYGPATMRAVIAFQKKRKLKPDGIVGPDTWGALFR